MYTTKYLSVKYFFSQFKIYKLTYQDFCIFTEPLSMAHA